MDNQRSSVSPVIVAALPVGGKNRLAALGKDAGAFYNGTILPISKPAVAGVLFYQGENNTFDAYETYAYSFALPWGSTLSRDP